MHLLIDRQAIEEKVEEIARKINTYFRFETSPIVFVGVLDGCFMFFSDLLKSITIPNIEIAFTKIKTYHGTQSIGKCKLSLPLPCIKNKVVVIVDDIIDTGKTAHFLKEQLLKEGAKNVYVCSLLDKPNYREYPIEPDFKGFVVPPVFVIGYGLDYNGKYRNLNAIFQYVGE